MTTVLVADDDADIRGLVTFKLTQAGYTVVGAPDGLTALELARAELPDLVVLDPPRSGAGKDVMAAVLGRRPRAVAYVACDPAALGRDLGIAARHGYTTVSVRGFDLFPMTQHVECVAILTPAD